MDRSAQKTSVSTIWSLSYGQNLHCRFAEDTFRDDEPHYLGCSLTYCHQPGIAPVPVNVELVCIAITAMNLDGLVAHVQRVLGGHDFCICVFGFVRRTSVFCQGRQHTYTSCFIVSA